jgi:hypothetical protein
MRPSPSRARDRPPYRACTSYAICSSAQLSVYSKTPPQCLLVGLGHPERHGRCSQKHLVNRLAAKRGYRAVGIELSVSSQLSREFLAVLKDWSVTWELKNVPPSAAVENIGQLAKARTRILRR